MGAVIELQLPASQWLSLDSDKWVESWKFHFGCVTYTKVGISNRSQRLQTCSNLS